MWVVHFHTADSGDTKYGQPTKEDAQRAVAALLGYVNNGAGDANDFFAIVRLSQMLVLRNNTV